MTDPRPMPPVSSYNGTGPNVGDEGRMVPPFVGGPAAEPEDLRWEAEADEEGTVEPVFEADVLDTEAKLAALSHIAKHDADFPMDAFIIPEHTSRLPSGVEAQPAQESPTHTPVTDLADRLEKLSHRLRVEGSEAVIARLVSGDKVDAMIAGLLSGILTTKP